MHAMLTPVHGLRDIVKRQDLFRRLQCSRQPLIDGWHWSTEGESRVLSCLGPAKHQSVLKRKTTPFLFCPDWARHSQNAAAASACHTGAVRSCVPYSMLLHLCTFVQVFFLFFFGWVERLLELVWLISWHECVCSGSHQLINNTWTQWPRCAGECSKSSAWLIVWEEDEISQLVFSESLDDL